ncbi:MAG: response regulator, partial [Dokdonella sp.]
MLNVLVADDNPITLEFLSSALGQLGWRCSVAPDGLSAVTLAASERFDVLLLDARMPGLNGVGALARIRAGARLSCSAPALATTAGTDRDQHAALLAEGFDAVLLKPISLSELSAALRRHAREPDRTNHASVMFDDERALSVVGGDAEIVRALRGLLLAELERLPGELA